VSGKFYKQSIIGYRSDDFNAECAERRIDSVEMNAEVSQRKQQAATTDPPSPWRTLPVGKIAVYFI